MLMIFFIYDFQYILFVKVGKVNIPEKGCLCAIQIDYRSDDIASLLDFKDVENVISESEDDDDEDDVEDSDDEDDEDDDEADDDDEKAVFVKDDSDNSDVKRESRSKVFLMLLVIYFYNVIGYLYLCILLLLFLKVKEDNTQIVLKRKQMDRSNDSNEESLKKIKLNGDEVIYYKFLKLQ